VVDLLTPAWQCTKIFSSFFVASSEERRENTLMSEILRAGETEKDGTDEVDNAHKVFGDVLCRVISDADIIIHEAFLVFECVPFFATVDDVLDAKRSDHCLIRSSLPIPKIDVLTDSGWPRKRQLLKAGKTLLVIKFAAHVGILLGERTNATLEVAQRSCSIADVVNDLWDAGLEHSRHIVMNDDCTREGSVDRFVDKSGGEWKRRGKAIRKEKERKSEIGLPDCWLTQSQSFFLLSFSLKRSSGKQNEFPMNSLLYSLVGRTSMTTTPTRLHEIML
jgi:hypothetical protein